MPHRELQNPYSYLRPAATNTGMLSQIRSITGLVQGPMGQVISASLLAQLEAENPGLSIILNVVTGDSFSDSHVRTSAALNSARAVRDRGGNPAEVWGPFSCDTCGRLGSSEGIAYGSRCNGGSGSGTTCGFYTHINEIDMLIRGFCNNCNNSGRYMADQHMCSGSKIYYTRSRPRVGFVFERSQGGTPLLARVFDTETDQVIGSIVGQPGRIAKEIGQYAETILVEDNRRIPTRVPLYMLKRHNRGMRLVHPLAIKSYVELRTIVAAELHYDSGPRKSWQQLRAGSGLQDGSITIGRRRYEGVPIPR